MRWWDHEPTLADILSDPIVRVVMAADGVDARKLEATLREIAIDRRTAQNANRCGRKGRSRLE
jgi:hypothetical protein